MLRTENWPGDAAKGKHKLDKPARVVKPCAMRFPFLLLALIVFSGVVHAQENPPAPATETSVAAVPTPSLMDAVVLGLVEGITEFLPVSSTGHLIIASEALGLDSAAPLQVPGRDEPVPFKQATDAYIVIIQIGAITAVAILYWRRVLSILAGLIGRDRVGAKLALNILVACLPAAILGLLFNDLIDEYLFSIGAVAVALIAGALLMFWVEAWRKRQPIRTDAAQAHATLETLRPRQALLIGCMQCLALWPGTSRSMVTIVGGYLAGLPPALAAEFSFLVGLPLLSAAAALKTFQNGDLVLAAFGSGPIVLGLVVAAVSAAVAVRFLVSFLTRHGLAAFAWYRLALAAVLLATMAF